MLDNVDTRTVHSVDAHDIDVVALANMFYLLDLEGCWRVVFLSVEISPR